MRFAEPDAMSMLLITVPRASCSHSPGRNSHLKHAAPSFNRMFKHRYNIAAPRNVFQLLTSGAFPFKASRNQLGRNVIDSRKVSTCEGVAYHHVRVFEGVAKRQFPPQGSGSQKSKARISTLLSEFTPSNTLAWQSGADSKAGKITFSVAVWQVGDNLSGGGHFKPISSGIVQKVRTRPHSTPCNPKDSAFGS